MAHGQQKIAFQGTEGAYSDLVCRRLYPDAAVLPCASFEDVFAAMQRGNASHAVIPLENSIAGRVADVHTLLPKSGLFITGEHYEKITHNLLVLPGTKTDAIKDVHSHVQALSQCRDYLRAQGFSPVVHSDTAGAARDVSYWKNPRNAAIASSLAAEIYGLEILQRDIADAAHNTTRFVVLERSARTPEYVSGQSYKTTLYFTLRNVPAALYKALGGFATNGINLCKIESYLSGGSFQAAEFFVEVEGHPETEAFRNALQELEFYSSALSILGVYPKGETSF